MPDMVFRDADPPEGYGVRELADTIVFRIGVKRKKSMADHGKLLLEMLRYRKSMLPIDVDEIAKILGVSKPQAYDEIKKWKDLGLVEVVSVPYADSHIRGYMLTAHTINKLIDRIESRARSFIKKTRRLAKELDDYLAVENLKERSEK